jgi:hypothetical protein
MPTFTIHNSGASTGDFGFWNGYPGYAAATIQNTPTIAAAYRGQSNATTSARHICRITQFSLRLAGGRYADYQTPTVYSVRDAYVNYHLWDASGNSLSASPLTNIPANLSKNVEDGDTLPAITLSITDVNVAGNTNYYWGFNNQGTLPADNMWSANSRSDETGQNIYDKYLSGTPSNDSFAGNTVLRSGVSLMGTVTYYTIPPAPVITSVTSVATGVKINFTVSETNSGTTTGCKAYYGSTATPTTPITGTFGGSAGSYNFTITSTLTLGQTYYFKVAALNAVTTADNTTNPTYDTRSLDSNVVSGKFGLGNYFIKVRNTANTAWDNAVVKIRDPTNTSWTIANINMRNADDTLWLNNT